MAVIWLTLEQLSSGAQACRIEARSKRRTHDFEADVRRIARALYSASASGEAEFHVGRETVSF